jgi:hypothetical protein
MKLGKLGIGIIILAILISSVGISYIWANVYINTIVEELDNTKFVNLTEIEIVSLSGTVKNVLIETNDIILREKGPTTYVYLEDENTTWQMSFENKTEHDARMFRWLKIGTKCTITFVNFYSLALDPHVVPRNNVIMDVERIV